MGWLSLGKELCWRGSSISRYGRWTLLACNLGSFGTGEVQQESKRFEKDYLTCAMGILQRQLYMSSSLRLRELGIILDVYVVSSLLMRPLFSLPPQTKERCQK